MTPAKRGDLVIITEFRSVTYQDKSRTEYYCHRLAKVTNITKEGRVTGFDLGQSRVKPRKGKTHACLVVTGIDAATVWANHQGIEFETLDDARALLVSYRPTATKEQIKLYQERAEVSRMVKRSGGIDL